MEEATPLDNVIRVKIDVDKPGVYKIAGRKFYCYQANNNVLCVIPRWYQHVVVYAMILVYLLGWWLG